MRKLALCFYGKIPATDIQKAEAIARFSNRDCILFENYDTASRSKSLMNVSYLKRQFEILNHFSFDTCVAIDSESDALMHTVLRYHARPGFVYFTKGYYLTSHGGTTGVNPEIFYAESMTFDRAAELCIGMQNMDSDWMTSDRIEEIFYLHLKSLDIKTECVNCENSDMFIRATTLD